MSVSRVDDRFCWLSRGPDNGCLELTVLGNNYAASRVSAWVSAPWSSSASLPGSPMHGSQDGFSRYEHKESATHRDDGRSTSPACNREIPDRDHLWRVQILIAPQVSDPWVLR